MSVVLLSLAVLAAGLVCPAMMLYQRRRGRQAACCSMPARSPDAAISDLRARQMDLRSEIERRSGRARH